MTSLINTCFSSTEVCFVLLMEGTMSINIFCFTFQSDADYWLLSDADVSITDMWRTERILTSKMLLLFLFSYFSFAPS
jgi:hypothetical protein